MGLLVTCELHTVCVLAFRHQNRPYVHVVCRLSYFPLIYAASGARCPRQSVGLSPAQLERTSRPRAITMLIAAVQPLGRQRGCLLLITHARRRTHCWAARLSDCLASARPPACLASKITSRAALVRRSASRRARYEAPISTTATKLPQLSLLLSVG